MATADPKTNKDILFELIDADYENWFFMNDGRRGALRWVVGEMNRLAGQLLDANKEVERLRKHFPAEVVDGPISAADGSLPAEYKRMAIIDTLAARICRCFDCIAAGPIPVTKSETSIDGDISKIIAGALKLRADVSDISWDEAVDAARLSWLVERLHELALAVGGDGVKEVVEPAPQSAGRPTCSTCPHYVGSRCHFMPPVAVGPIESLTYVRVSMMQSESCGQHPDMARWIAGKRKGV